MTSAGETEGLLTINSVFFASFVNGFGVVVIFDVFIEGDVDTVEGVDDINDGTPVEVGVILEIYTKDGTNFLHKGGGAGSFVLVVHIVTPIDFVDFAGGSTGRGGFEVAGEGEHGNIASFLV